MLTWKYPEKEMSVGSYPTMTLVRGEEEDIIFDFGGDNVFWVHKEDIAYIIFVEAKLFRKGFISLYGHDDEILEYVLEGREFPFTLEITRADLKGNFYLIFDILQKHGYDVRPL